MCPPIGRRGRKPPRNIPRLLWQLVRIETGQLRLGAVPIPPAVSGRALRKSEIGRTDQSAILTLLKRHQSAGYFRCDPHGPGSRSAEGEEPSSTGGRLGRNG